MADSKYDHDPEALAWARSKVARTVVRLRKLADHCSESSEPERAGGYRAASWIVTNNLLGSNGCVIAGFDERLPKILDAMAATPTEE